MIDQFVQVFDKVSSVMGVVALTILALGLTWVFFEILIELINIKTLLKQILEIMWKGV